MLIEENIYLNQDLKNKADVFNFLGEIIESKNLAAREYINSMKNRDLKSSVAIGNYLAIPHSEFEGLKYINQEAIIFIKLAKPIKWDDNEILFIIALIVKESNQIELLAKIALAFSEEKLVKKFHKKLKEKTEVFKFISID